MSLGASNIAAAKVPVGTQTENLATDAKPTTTNFFHVLKTAACYSSVVTGALTGLFVATVVLISFFEINNSAIFVFMITTFLATGFSGIVTAGVGGITGLVALWYFIRDAINANRHNEHPSCGI
ncbi:MAG: hypothetical protein LBI34_03645 [Puniceicoccales bacterium]|jgi:hypothetical protein|nr:hypothetical protein [Puniceicoccales bacterium]